MRSSCASCTCGWASERQRITVSGEGIETLFGSYDENLKHLESRFNVRIRTQGHDLLVEGESPDLARVDRIVGQLSSLMRDGYRLSNSDVKTASELVAQVSRSTFAITFSRECDAAGKRRVAPKTANQRKYLDAIEQHDIVFGIGRPGRENVSGHGAGGGLSRGEEGHPHHPGAPGGRGRRKARFLPGDLRKR